jgi:hypothetical protein
MLADEALALEIEIHLQELKDNITAKKLVEYLAHPNVMIRHGITKAISIWIACQHLKAVSYQFTKQKKDNLVMDISALIMSTIVKRSICQNGKSFKHRCTSGRRSMPMTVSGIIEYIMLRADFAYWREQLFPTVGKKTVPMFGCFGKIDLLKTN